MSVFLGTTEDEKTLELEEEKWKIATKKWKLLEKKMDRKCAR